MKNHYKNTIYDGWELKFFDLAKNFRNYQISLVKKFLSGNVSEVGPGNGSFYQRYKKFPKKIDLYEPSSNFINVLNNKKNKNTFVFNIFFKKKENYYDTIMYMDVIEHINNDFLEISKASQSLKKNGKLIINVPAFQHLYSNFDKDINHKKRYHKQDFVNISKKLNLKIIELKYYDSIGYFLSLISKMLKSNYKKNFDKKIKIWDTLVPISRILDIVFFNSFGKSLIVVFEKE